MRAIAAVILCSRVFSADHVVLQGSGLHKNGWFQFAIQNPHYSAYTVFNSTDLQSWSSIAVLHGPMATPLTQLPFVAPAAGANGGFYRVASEPITFEHDWRNQAIYPDDPFRSEELNFGKPEIRWIKFCLLTDQPKRVYYQDSSKYKFHYNFATKRLPAFQGMSAAEFDAVSLRTNEQKVVLGTLLFPPSSDLKEVGVQFVGLDTYPPERVAEWFESVRATILPLDDLKVVYIPVYEQTAAAEANRPYFAARGIEVSNASAWDTGQSPYSAGWAIGVLKFVPSGQINEAYANGIIGPTDILLTDAVPAEIPFVAGIITLSPSTPNSHVALLAHSYGVPFVYLGKAEDRALAQSFIGKEIVLTAYDGWSNADIRLLDVSSVEPTVRDQLAAARLPTQISITPKARRGAYIENADRLVPADRKYFGGKAANFGLLRREVPTNSPPALAISFDLWDDFLAQRLASGVVLREEIERRLKKYNYPPNVAALETDLKAIRDLIEDETQFTSEQQRAIAAALLGKFDPNKKIRFRSSTNVEDTEQFVGAGLYESHSGCLADDQDTDSEGPSECDPTEPKERGVFRAIRKVYASFYNQNAVLERMRHGVEESEVGMAVLVHYSNPDTEELANGVATVSFEKRPDGRSYVARMVSQRGAVSVTNPDGSAQPEIVSVSKYFSTPYSSLVQSSTLVPLGAHVLEWTAEYERFGELFSKVALAFEGYYPAKTNYMLDFEYKKISLGDLLVKQVRELPRSTADTNPTYLLNRPVEWSVFQGEYGTVFANHRLKARFSLETRDFKVSSNNLAGSIFSKVAMDYPDGNQVKNLTGNPGGFPEATHEVGEADFAGIPVVDSWRLTLGTGDRRVALSAYVPTGATDLESPILTLDRLSVSWTATYATGVPSIEFAPEIILVTNETVRLVPTPRTNAASVLVSRHIPVEAGTSIWTSFYWPQPPSGVGAGYTAPLVAWKETRIEGLTSEPIILHDYFSQTYRPEHHNFSENFIFEPALEPGISPGILSELEQKNICYIYVRWGGVDSPSTVYVADREWRFRPLTKPGLVKP